MMPQNFCCEGSQDGNNETSSRGSRVAYADLRRSTTSSDSDSTVSTNADEIGQRKPCRKSRADLEFRLSATYTRRHSSPGPRLAREACTSLKSPSEGSHDNEEGIMRRKKSQPRHRCASMNESVSSILKPPKYSLSLSSSITTVKVATVQLPRFLQPSQALPLLSRSHQDFCAAGAWVNPA